MAFISVISVKIIEFLNFFFKKYLFFLWGKLELFMRFIKIQEEEIEIN